MTTLVWIRRDLRLHDQPALLWAIKLKKPIIPIFIWAPDEEKPWSPGAASRWWLHHSIEKFNSKLQSIGSQLIIRKGKSLETLEALAKETKASSILWNRLYEPAIVARDEKIKISLRASGLEVKSFNGALLIEPWQIKNKSGTPYKVFTPFYNAFPKNSAELKPLSTIKELEAPPKWPSSIALDKLELLPKISWDRGLKETWIPGEESALKNLKGFLKNGVSSYKEARDIPSIEGTSRLSPHLHFGEISPRFVLQQAQATAKSDWFIRELIWREFAHHILFHFPHTSDEPLDEKFKNFPWIKNKKYFTAWAKGETGYSIVDAGMKELWTTGYMHNRVRMIVASFLTKDLLLSWKDGAEWFWDTLVDASLANNSMGWQWAGGCGADAAPYFRVFNPSLQAEKFDPHTIYIKKWLGARKMILPIVDHKVARDRALEAYKQMKGT